VHCGAGGLDDPGGGEMNIPTIVVISAICGGLSVYIAMRLSSYVQALEKMVRELADTVRAQGECNKKHIPYITAEEIEHAIAVALWLQQEVDRKQDLLNNLLFHLQKARNPSGKK
jgi:hypothetical protein